MRFGIILIGLVACVYSQWSVAPRLADTLRGQPEEHRVSGSNRFVCVKDTCFMLGAAANATSRSEYLFRVDNYHASNYTIIDTIARYGGSICLGKDSTLYKFDIPHALDSVRYKSQKWNQTWPSGYTGLYSHADISLSGNPTDNRMTSCTVDSSGTVYFATHWAVTGATTADRLWLFWKRPGDPAFSGPWVISSDNARRAYYVHLDVDRENRLIWTFYDETTAGGGQRSRFCRMPAVDSVTSTCVTLDSVIAGVGIWTNPSPLVYGVDSICVTYQSGSISNHANEGVIEKCSIDDGATWTARQIVRQTCGYADGHLAKGNNGRIYLVFRGTLTAAADSSSCGDISYAFLYESSDFGTTWTPVDSAVSPTHFVVATRIHNNYQTWYHRNKYLMWLWMEERATNNSMKWDYNPEITLYNHADSLSVVVPPPAVDRVRSWIGSVKRRRFGM